MNNYRESSFNQMKEAVEFLESLPIGNANNSIWWCLHQVVWHQHLDRVMWIVNNKKLIKKITGYSDIPPVELLNEFRESLKELKPPY